MDTLSLRPLDIPEVIDAAIKLLRRHAGTMFTISAVVLAPLGVIQYLFLAPALNRFSAFALDPVAVDPDLAIREVMALMGSVSAVILLVVIGQLAIQLGSIKAISDVYLDRTPSWRESLAVGMRRLPTALGAGVIAIVPLVVGFLFCLLPGLWLATCWSMTAPAIVAEDKGPRQALGRSFSMVTKRFWPVLGTLALMAVVSWVLELVGSGIIQVITLMSGTLQVGLATIIGSALSAVILPFNAAVVAVLYFDLRVRQEGFDLERLAASMGAPVPLPSTATGPPALPAHPGEPPALPGGPDPDDPFGLGAPGGP